MTKFVAVAFCAIFSFAGVGLQQSKDTQKSQTQQMACPMMQDAHSQMNERGEKGMGFSQTATTHHFFLTKDGGVIQVTVNDASDTTNRDNIRMHLNHIAEAFKNGDFAIPMFVHDTVPPGVAEMKQLQQDIHYSFEELPEGGRVVIDSTSQAAINAIHDFLRFQIEEHKTGDSSAVN